MKYILTIFLFFLFVFSSNAQFIKSIGIKGGITPLNQKLLPNDTAYTIILPLNPAISINEQYNSGIGQYHALSLEFIDSKFFSFSTDFGYSEKKYKHELHYNYSYPPQPCCPALPSEVTTHQSFTYKSKYFQIEPLIKSRITYRHLNIYALLGVRYNFSSGSSDIIFNKIKYYNFGLTAGSGLEYKIKDVGIHAEVKYHHNFGSSIYNPNPVRATSPYYDIKDKAYIINAGIRMYLQKEEKVKIHAKDTSVFRILKSIGIKGGQSTATQSFYFYNGPPPKDFHVKSSISGIYGAISAELFNTKYFSLVIDLGYCEKGVKYDLTYYNWDPNGALFNGSYQHSTFTNSFKYFQLETFIKSRKDAGYLSYYALLGPRADLNFADDREYFTAVEPYGNKSIWGLTAGAGMEYKINRIGINAEIKYQHDFSYAVDYAPPYYNGFWHKIKNKAYIISTGIKYYFQKKENQQENQQAIPYENKD